MEKIKLPKQNAWEYLKAIGVPDIPARTSPFDPGYDPPDTNKPS